MSNFLCDGYECQTVLQHILVNDDLQLEMDGCVPVPAQRLILTMRPALP